MAETDNDPSASTAMFRAFAQRSEDDVTRGRRASAPSHRPVIVAAIVVACLLVVAVILALAL